jgi:hypothetical protein
MFKVNRRPITYQIGKLSRYTHFILDDFFFEQCATWLFKTLRLAGYNFFVKLENR